MGNEICLTKEEFISFLGEIEKMGGNAISLGDESLEDVSGGSKISSRLMAGTLAALMPFSTPAFAEVNSNSEVVKVKKDSKSVVSSLKEKVKTLSKDAVVKLDKNKKIAIPLATGGVILVPAALILLITSLEHSETPEEAIKNYKYLIGKAKTFKELVFIVMQIVNKLADKITKDNSLNINNQKTFVEVAAQNLNSTLSLFDLYNEFAFEACTTSLPYHLNFNNLHGINKYCKEHKVDIFSLIRKFEDLLDKLIIIYDNLVYKEYEEKYENNHQEISADEWFEKLGGTHNDISNYERLKNTDKATDKNIKSMIDKDTQREQKFSGELGINHNTTMKIENSILENYDFELRQKNSTFGYAQGMTTICDLVLGKFYKQNPQKIDEPETEAKIYYCFKKIMEAAFEPYYFSKKPKEFNLDEIYKTTIQKIEKFKGYDNDFMKLNLISLRLTFDKTNEYIPGEYNQSIKFLDNIISSCDSNMTQEEISSYIKKEVDYIFNMRILNRYNKNMNKFGKKPGDELSEVELYQVFNY